MRCPSWLKTWNHCEDCSNSQRAPFWRLPPGWYFSAPHDENDGRHYHCGRCEKSKAYLAQITRPPRVRLEDA